ncbi:MAG TPA: DUF559 domain-containing protein [Solirubrobacterales bacterium]|jgi:hypothetical protein|nr:DUF559 domain-containing protein [Solirubrobacterales bacterium]
MAAVRASGPDAVLSHWSAAALWGIRPNSRSVIDVTEPVKSRSWDGIRRHHKALPADEITVEKGIPVTTVPRTIFDLAATEPLDVLKALLREAEFLELHDRLSLWDLVELWPELRQIVELDGWQAHKSRSAFREDKARDRRLAAAGYTVTHLTWNQLDDEPEAVASDLRVLLGIDERRRKNRA